MLSLQNLLAFFVILSFISFSSCNNLSNNDKTSRVAIAEDSSSTNLKSNSMEITPIIRTGYFDIEKIVNKGMIAFTHIDYQDNKIKIAIPAYSNSDQINIKTSFHGPTFFINIEVPQSTNDFTHTAYIDVDVEDINQYENYEIKIFTNSQSLYTKIIDNESLTTTAPDGEPTTANFVTETYEVPQHFYDYFKNDSIIIVYPNESLNQIDIIDFVYYESEINSISLDTSNKYLFVNIDETQNYDIPVNEPRINLYTITSLSDRLNTKEKIKVTRNSKNRKTISRSPNRKLDIKL